MVYPALLPLMLPVVDWTDAPCRFKWTRPFRRKTKSGFCACAIAFQTRSNTAATSLKVAVFWDIIPSFDPTFQINEYMERSVRLHQTTQCHVLDDSKLQNPFWVNKKWSSNRSSQLPPDLLALAVWHDVHLSASNQSICLFRELRSWRGVVNSLEGSFRVTFRTTLRAWELSERFEVSWWSFV
jgi:hypothetical protein